MSKLQNAIASHTLSVGSIESTVTMSVRDWATTETYRITGSDDSMLHTVMDNGQEKSFFWEEAEGMELIETVETYIEY